MVPKCNFKAFFDFPEPEKHISHDELFYFTGKPQKFVLELEWNFCPLIHLQLIHKIDQWQEEKIMTYTLYKVLFVNFWCPYMWTGGTSIWSDPKTNCLLPVTSNWFGVLWFFRGNRADAVVSFWKCDSHGLPLPLLSQFHFLLTIFRLLLHAGSIFFLLQKTEFVWYLGGLLTDIFQPFLGTLTKFCLSLKIILLPQFIVHSKFINFFVSLNFRDFL